MGYAAAFSRAAACEGKKTFESAKLACEVAKSRRRHKTSRRAYRCPHCGLYHLATNHGELHEPYKRPRSYMTALLAADV